MDVTIVSPFTVRTDNHSTILSELRDYKHHTTSTKPCAYGVPVVHSDDIDKIISDNDQRKAAGSRKDVSSTELETMQDSIGGAEVLVQPTKFVELLALEPTNRQQQMATVLLENFPAFRKNVTEHLIQYIMRLAPPALPKQYCWSVVTYGSTGSHSDTTNVFVRFASVQAAEWLRGNTNHLSLAMPGVAIAYDNGLEPSTNTMSDSDIQDLQKEYARLKSNTNNYSIDTNRTGTEDLDEVMQYYRTYKVENSELVEVPKELKETIVKDIIKFRSKVLTIERDRRKKEIERERRMAKLRLTQVFEGIRSATEVSNEKDMDVDLEEKTDPMDELNDEQYEAFLADQQKSESEKAYRAKVAQMEALEVGQKQKLLDRLDAAINYETNVIDNKFAIMDEIKDLLDFDPAKPGTSRLRLYYTDHGEYVRLRNAERAREERLDKEDAEHDVKPVEQPVQETREEPNQPQVQEMDVDIVVADLSEKALDAIQTKIGDLIEEYLGIREDVLIDFVFDFVKEKNLSLREELVAELLETLDEDSKTVVDQLHEYIKTFG